MLHILLDAFAVANGAHVCIEPLSSAAAYPTWLLSEPCRMLKPVWPVTTAQPHVLNGCRASPAVLTRFVHAHMPMLGAVAETSNNSSHFAGLLVPVGTTAEQAFWATNARVSSAHHIMLLLMNHEA
jgi:hypothetical protein